MKKKQLERITKGYCRELMLCSEKLLPGFNINAVHHFRVQYKKLRAFLRMIRTEPAASGHLRLPKHLKMVYGLAGSVRDLQLHRQRVQYVYRNSKKKPETYLLQVKQATAKCKKELSVFFSENNIKTGAERIMQALPDSFSNKALHHYTQKQWELVVQLIDAGHFTDANMHLIRKMLKDLYYNIGVLDQDSFVVKIGKQQRTISLKLFSTLMGQLGKFQDLTTEIRMLGTFHLKELPVTEQKELRALRANCIIQKNKLKRDLAVQLKTGFGSA
ncbi:MAG: CHAD domain-containing protein [Sediminibacterium sp.]|nr:CHAD domain-containing protein [Sediminibacterium sp.]